MKASEKELEDSGESCERWGGFGAGLVVLGVAAEIAIAAYHPPYDSFLEQWGSAIANSLVAIGIAIEIQFGRMGRRRQNELQRRSNHKLADALDRATRAERELIALRKPRRDIFKGNENNLENGIRGFSGTIFDIGMGPNDGEVEDFIWDLEPILANAGWQQIDWRYPLGQTGGIKRGGVGSRRPSLGEVAALNVMIEVHPPELVSMTNAAHALADALNAIGIEAHVIPFNIWNGNANALHILIGPKR